MAKKKESNQDLEPGKWPVVKDGLFVCSDGFACKDGCYAREHQRYINKQHETLNKE